MIKMKMKLLSILGLFLLIGVAVAGGMHPFAIEKSLNATLNFSKPIISYNENYEIVNVERTDSFMMNPGYPMLPYKTKVITFPFGTKINGMEVKTGEIITKQLNKKIQPAPPAIPLNMENVEVEAKEGSIYQSNEAYPSDWVKYNIGAGIENGKHVIFLSIHAFPCRYIPAKNELMYTNEMKIKVNYEPPEKMPIQNDVYDLLIIAPSEFSDALQPLVEHKENHGVKTKLVTLNEIYNGAYFTSKGRDDAEKVKYFIKDAIEQWGIKYVLLVGGRHGGLTQQKWWCPVRYTNLDDGSNWETGYLSDLYFADIYKYEGNETVFDDWDSNGNGIYAEWWIMGKDTLDFYPDVYVGRLPARNKFEVTNMVEKIINYETTTYGQQWFKKIVAVGGDTFPGEDDPYYEGELATSKSVEYMQGFDAVKLYTSDHTLGNANDVINAVSQGCGFLNFEGHGNPMGWATHPPHDENTWIDGLKVQEMHQLSNKGMYPVCVVGGCHNSQFNVSLLNLLKIYEGYQEWYSYIYKGEMSPESWSWWIVRMAEGGAIASIGCTGLGYGTIGDFDGDGIPDCIQYLGGFIDSEFFRVYAQEGKDILGEAYGTTLTNYIAKFPPMEDKIDAKTVQEWVLMGDPSLKIGGYPS